MLRNKHPELVIVTGPRDTGKTRLIETVLRDSEQKDRSWPLHINMRDPLHHWTSVEASPNLHNCFLSAHNRSCESVLKLDQAHSTPGPWYVAC